MIQLQSICDNREGVMKMGNGGGGGGGGGPLPLLITTSHYTLQITPPCYPVTITPGEEVMGRVNGEGIIEFD